MKLYASGSAFLEDRFPDDMSCLVLDVRLPETSGIKIQEKLSRAGVYVPIVFVTGYGDVATAVGAMKAGAVDFLTKPFRSPDLLLTTPKVLGRVLIKGSAQPLQEVSALPQKRTCGEPAQESA